MIALIFIGSSFCNNSNDKSKSWTDFSLEHIRLKKKIFVRSDLIINPKSIL